MAQARAIPTKRSPAAQRWITVVAAYERSGLGLREFAAQQGLKWESLSWWRRRVLATRPAFVEVELPPPVAPSGSAPLPSLRLELPKLGVAVPVPPGTDLHWLRQVLGALA